MHGFAAKLPISGLAASLAALLITGSVTAMPSTSSLSNKRILLGITGGIAAYKSAELARLLGKAGAEVRVVMTRAATEFITPLTLQALTGNRVHLDLLDPEAEAAMGHIQLARWADLILVAPASADFLARVAAGRADDLLSTLVLATAAPVALAPAMNQVMWQDEATQQNLATLINRGYLQFGPGSGDQACGETGPGRLLEPAELVELAASTFASAMLSGRHLLITAGPTREAIDPVRYISNHSSGKMGFALAEEAVAAGARVTLISGPVALPTPERVRRIDVVSAEEMLAACLNAVVDCDVFIGVAAVADYRPATAAPQKIKKHAEHLSLELVRNPDIISRLAQQPKRPFMVGFAAETGDLLANGKAKLAAKRLDLLFANDATATFGADEVSAIAIDREQSRVLPAGNKHVVARHMLQLIAEQLPPL